jgi:hypothetical protein
MQNRLFSLVIAEIASCSAVICTGNSSKILDQFLGTIRLRLRRDLILNLQRVIHRVSSYVNGEPFRILLALPPSILIPTGPSVSENALP